MKRIIIAFTSLLMLFSCKSFDEIYTNISLTNIRDYPVLNDSQKVQVYLIEDSIAGFKEIGVIEIYTVRRFRSMPSLDEAVEITKGIARKNGANCIIMLNDFLRSKRNERNLYNYWFRIGYKDFIKDSI